MSNAPYETRFGGYWTPEFIKENCRAIANREVVPLAAPVRCGHQTGLKRSSTRDCLICAACEEIVVEGWALAALGFSCHGRYSAESNALADEAQRLRDEFAETTRENVSLRREVETLRRKLGSKR